MNPALKHISQVKNEPGTGLVQDDLLTREALKALCRDLVPTVSARKMDRSMRLIVERALTLTRSNGVAMALSQGDEMVCVATAGSHAPPSGAQLQTQSGFSAECVRTGRLLRCDDSEVDDRVDHLSCCRLGIRSLIGAPINSGERVVGLLEVFSARPNNYSTHDEEMLKEIAEITKIALRLGSAAPKTADEPHGPSTADPSATSVIAGIEPSKAIQSIGSNAKLLSSHPVEPRLRVQPRLQNPRSGDSTGMLVLVFSLAVFAGILWSYGPWVHPQRVAATANRQQLTTPASASNTFETTASVRPYADDLASVRDMAEQGNPAAQFALGAKYAIGEEVGQDYSEAVRWFSSAAEQGHTVSQAILGSYYDQGRGVARDLSKAYFWSTLAQAGGDQASKYRATILSSRMTPSQLRAAREQADKWLVQHQTRAANSSHSGPSASDSQRAFAISSNE